MPPKPTIYQMFPGLYPDSMTKTPEELNAVHNQALLEARKRALQQFQREQSKNALDQFIDQRIKNL